MFKYLNSEYITGKSGELVQGVKKGDKIKRPKRIIRGDNGSYIVGEVPQPLVRLIDEDEAIHEFDLYDCIKKNFGRVTKKNAQIVFDNMKNAGEIPNFGPEIENIDQYCAH